MQMIPSPVENELTSKFRNSPLPAKIDMEGGNAVFSPCGNYRYALWRTWNQKRGTVLFMGLNPSTADATRDDPTIRRCLGFAKDWGYGSLLVGNLFAFKATRPQILLQSTEPIGPENDIWLRRLSAQADLTVVCWGNHGAHLGRDREVLTWIKSPHCLGATRTGLPRHPLYLSKESLPFPYSMPMRHSGTIH